jgi:hypothetical protein
MPSHQPVSLPQGTWTSQAAAAAALGVSRYRIRELQQQAQAQGLVPDAAATTATMPMTWSVYMSHSDTQREAWYQAWCRRQGLDPNSDSTGYAWGDAFRPDGTEPEDLTDWEGES